MLKFVKSFQCDSFFQVNEKQKRYSFAYLTIKKCPWHFFHEESCAFPLCVFLTRSRVDLNIRLEDMEMEGANEKQHNVTD